MGKAEVVALVVLGLELLRDLTFEEQGRLSSFSFLPYFSFAFCLLPYPVKPITYLMQMPFSFSNLIFRKSFSH